MKPEPLPDCRQRDSHDCGTACLRTLWQFHYGQQRKLIDLSTPADGLDPATMRAQLLKLGWNVLAGTMTVDDLRHFTAAGRPVVCLVTIDGGGHYVVVGGVWRGKVWHHCPLNGWTGQHIDEWQQSWHDSNADGVRYVNWGLCSWPAV